MQPTDPDMTRTPHRVGFVVFDGVTMLDVSGPSEVLHQAGRLATPYELLLVSPRGGAVATSTGPALGGTSTAADAGPLDTVMVAGGDRLAEGPVEPELLDTVSALAGRAGRVASVCTGAFVLAELGLLDGRRAATHWRHAETLARRYPRVRVEPDAIHVRDGRYVTVGEATGDQRITLTRPFPVTIVPADLIR